MDEKVKKVVSEIEKMPLTKEEWDIINNLLSLLSEKEKEIAQLLGDKELVAYGVGLSLEKNGKLKARIKELEKTLRQIKSDPSIGRLEVEDWLESPDY